MPIFTDEEVKRRTRRVSPASGKSDSATSFYQADSLTTVTNSPKPWQLNLVSERLCPAHNRVCPIRHSTAAFHEVIHGRLLVTPPFPGAWSSPRTTSSWWRMRRLERGLQCDQEKNEQLGEHLACPWKDRRSLS